MTPSRPSRSRSRSPIVRVTFDAVLLVAAMFGPFAAQATAASEAQEALLKSVGSEHGIVAVLDFPDSDAASVLELAQGNHWRIYFQSDKPEQVDQVRKAADEAGLLGTRLFVDAGSFKQIQLANNVADGLVVSPNAATRVKLDEMFRVLRPKASVIVDSAAVIAKPLPAGTDVWSHPYHGPDNNPQSKDKIARGELRTQFINEPKFSPMPEQTVIAGGRIYKALGHIAHRRNQNKQLNTLFCINAYNGTILWKRSLPEGFMIHRNTMVATDDALYLGDNESCKVLDAKTGRVLENITFAKDLTDGPVWKWMAIDDGTLYAMIGNEEVKISTRPSDKPGLGHWPWEMWQGHEYANPKTSFGFGRTIVAIDLKTKKLKWNYQSEEFIDARALAMNNNHILAYSPEKFLTAVDRTTGEVAWQTDSADVLAAIGALGGAQHWVTGYSTTCYMKCSDDYVYFAGPQCKRMTVVSAANGELAWTHPDGNLQLVLRDDAIYAAGPKSTGVRLDYKTGKVLGELPTRRACTRATGAVDSVFYRAKGGTVRVLTDSKESDAQHIAAMRPPCQDGVIISNGHFYWGPWMCGCELSLYGNIALGPAAGRTFPTDASLYKSALATISGKQPAPLAINENDWPSFRAGNQRHDRVSFTLPRSVKTNWQSSINTKEMPTAPVAAGDMVFVADRSGVVQAYAADGTTAWKNYTGGAIYYAPAVANDRLYVGSADGRVYAFAAKTGELLWSFQVAPAVERINVFGQLVSRWPVAGGVVVQGNKLYAVAGIANYDGTYVVALDAKSGELLAQNSTSGKLAQKVNGGISLQGNISIAGGELRFLGGGVYETARYDLETLACLNKPAETLEAEFQTAFYPFYPKYGKFVSLQASCPTGVVCYAARYEGNLFSNITLQETPTDDKPLVNTEQARKMLRRHGKILGGKNIWADTKNRRFTSFIASDDVLIATGHTEEAPDKPFIVAINIADGTDIWKHDLAADAVKGGIAIDHKQRIFVTLENGELLCFGAGE